MKKIPDATRVALGQQSIKNKIMKTQSIPRYTLMLLLFVVFNYSFAQTSAEYAKADNLSKSNAYNTNTEVKKSFSTNTKLQQSFHNYFKEATDVNWNMVGNDYLVSFKTAEMKTRALFSKSGVLLYTLHYGSEKNLPASIDEQVRSTYYDYQITSAIQVNIGKHNIWIVNLKDNASYIILRIEDNQMEVMQQYHE